jgi:hypothetical protein
MSQTKVPTKESLQRRRTVTISDLLVKADNEDWRGVADAAMDLREIDAMLDVLPKNEAKPTPTLDEYNRLTQPITEADRIQRDSLERLSRRIGV